VPIILFRGRKLVVIMRQKKELRGRGLSEFSKHLSEFRRPRSFFLTHNMQLILFLEIKIDVESAVFGAEGKVYIFIKGFYGYRIIVELRRGEP